jgi:uncharacterized protein YggE
VNRIPIAFLFVAALLAPISAMAQAPERPQSQPLVVVAGEGVVRAAPDRVVVLIAVESRARDPRDAQRQNATVMTAVQGRLRQAGIPPDAVRTLGYDLQPEFDYAGGRQTLRGYLARNTIEVTLDTLERTGEVIDLSIGAGATSIHNLRFDLKSRANAEREALRLAVADARARAEAAAEGAGQRIERIWRIEESTTVRPPVPVLMREAVAAGVPSTPITAGDIEIRAHVTLSAVLR